MRFLVSLCICFLCVGAHAADNAEAAALADAGIDLLAKGKAEKAREQFYKSLVHDASCPIALFELGKLFEQDGSNAAAADFLSRAVTEFGKREKNDPSYASKKIDAARRLKNLNPYDAQFSTYLEEYSSELNRVAKKFPDSLTLETARSRVDSLQLASLLPKDKLPSIAGVIANNKPPASSPSEATGNSVPPDVERALKNNGWSTITGTWKKKSDNVYEVTNGKLESAKTNGAAQVAIQSGSGSLKIFVRDGHTAKDFGFTSSSSSSMAKMSDKYGSGYGVVIKDGNAKVFAPTGGFSSTDDYYPYLFSNVALPAGKSSVVITCQDTEKASRLEININGKRENLSNYRIKRSGPMVIEITGTLVIESPQAAGG